MCGQVFCNQCSSYYIDGSSINLQGIVRSCKLCHDQLFEKNEKIVRLNRLRKMDSNSLIKRDDTEIFSYERQLSICNSVAKDAFKAAQFYESTEEKQLNFTILQNRASMHFESIVKQLIQQSIVSENGLGGIWEEKIVSLVREVVAAVDPNVREGDNLDIRSYVKVKIIPGGEMNETKYIDGVVFASTVSHKNMMIDCERVEPRVLIIAGAIDFQRVDSKLVSMDILIEQEDKYIELLVDKIMSLKPDIILVGKSVARKAQELFCNYKVIVMQNMKQSRLEYISRMTGAKILTSTDQIYDQDCLGKCGKFFMTIVSDNPEKLKFQKSRRILKSRVAKGTTYAYFQGCPTEKGCTIVIRGYDRDFLREIKRILRFSILVAYHLRLEVSFYSDRYAVLPSSSYIENDDGEDSDDEFVNVLPFSFVPGKKQPMRLFSEKSNRVLLSSSLDIDFSLPFCNEVRGLNGYNSIAASVAEKTSSEDHQTIIVTSVLMLGNSQKTKSSVKGIRFYTSQDLSLGQFLMENCFNFEKNLNRESSMLDQTLSFIHRTGRLDITVLKQNDPTISSSSASYSAEDEVMFNTSFHQLQQQPYHSPGLGLIQVYPILMSSYCCKCQSKVTPDVPLSDESWKMSFGKFIEMFLYNRSAKCRIGSCGHILRDDHVLYFSCENFLTKFQYFPIHPFSLHIRSSLKFLPQFHLKEAYSILTNLPDQLSILIEGFRGTIQSIRQEALEITHQGTVNSSLALGNDINVILNELKDIENELQHEVSIICGSISNTLLLLPSPVLGEINDDVSGLVNSSEEVDFKSISNLNEFYKNMDNHLKYPNCHKKHIFIQATLWNTRIHGLVRDLEVCREKKHMVSNPPSTATMIPSMLTPFANPQVISTANLNNESLSVPSSPSKLDHFGMAADSMLLLDSTTRQAKERLNSIDNSTISKEVSISDEKLSLENFQSNSSHNIESNAISSDLNDITSSLPSSVSTSMNEKSDARITYATDTNTPKTLVSVPLQSNKNRFAKMVSRLVMGGTEEIEHNKYEVNLGELGKGHLSMPVGRKGEVIAVHETEFATIIAYSLASIEYHDMLMDMSAILDEENEFSDDENELRKTNSDKLRRRETEALPGIPLVTVEPIISIDTSDEKSKGITNAKDVGVSNEIQQKEDSEEGMSDDDIFNQDDDSDDGNKSIRSPRNASLLAAVSKKFKQKNDLKQNQDDEVNGLTNMTQIASSNVEEAPNRVTNKVLPTLAAAVRVVNPKNIMQHLSPSISGTSSSNVLNTTNKSVEVEHDHEFSTTFVTAEEIQEIEIAPQMASVTLSSSSTSTTQALAVAESTTCVPSTSISSHVATLATPLDSSMKQDDSPFQTSSQVGTRHPLEKQLLSQKKTHIKHRFEDLNDRGEVMHKFQCHVYWATQFEAIRSIYLKDIENEEFIRSLSTINNWNTKGGKSGATFSKSKDDRFVIKAIDKVELGMFLDFAPAYFGKLSL